MLRKVMASLTKKENEMKIGWADAETRSVKEEKESAATAAAIAA